YESRYCTFAVPDNWVPQPPFGYAEPGDDEGRLSAQALERWLPKATTAAAHAARLKELLPALYSAFELVGEGRFPAAAAPSPGAVTARGGWTSKAAAAAAGNPAAESGREGGEGRFLTFKYRNGDHEAAIARVIYLLRGPLACELTLSGSVAASPERDRERLWDGIAKTFSLRGLELLSRLELGRPLFSEGLQAAILAGPRRQPTAMQKFPRAGVALPPPAGWEVAEEEGDAVLRRNEAEIRLRRPVGVAGGDGNAGAWFAWRMRQLQDSAGLVLGCERGKLAGVPYAAVLHDEKAQTRSWSTAAARRTLELFRGTQPPQWWALRAHESAMPDLRPVLEQLVAAAETLPPEEWQLKLAEPWIDFTLEGPWQAASPGLYATLTERQPLFAHLASAESKLALATLRPQAVASLRRGAALERVDAENEVLGEWRGYPALRYSLDGASRRAPAVSVRAVWLAPERRLYSLYVQGAGANVADPLFLGLLEAIRLPR
ncbi:MAG TPA: hypothetical protein VMW75_00915, partial [Thermoanaerobaculia bacterium]|nr:hypothetical protein [Thermoanaerobaculia bacterium]